MSDTSSNPDSVQETERREDRNPGKLIRFEIPTYLRVSITGIFVILAMSSLYLARDFFLPITVAFILALTLSPVIRFLSRWRIPSAVSAVCLVVLVAGAGLLAVSLVALPIADWIDRAPQIGDELKDKLKGLKAPIKAVTDAQEEMEKATGNGEAQVRAVTIEGPGFLATAASSFLTAATAIVVTLVLLTFLLASGDMFYAKLVQSYERLRDKKRALKIVHDVERVVSRYLFTITLINISLGIVIGAGLYFLGMPQAYTWGAVAALANFMPYIGAILGLVAVTVVAIVSFDAIGPAITVSAFYFMCTFVEGQFVTPLVVGRRLELNAVAVFLSVAFWAWLWGIVGALIAVPVLVIFKTMCDHLEYLEQIGRFLSGSVTSSDSSSDETEQSADSNQ